MVWTVLATHFALSAPGRLRLRAVGSILVAISAREKSSQNNYSPEIIVLIQNQFKLLYLMSSGKRNLSDMLANYSFRVIVVFELAISMIASPLLAPVHPLGGISFVRGLQASDQNWYPAGPAMDNLFYTIYADSSAELRGLQATAHWSRLSRPDGGNRVSSSTSHCKCNSRDTTAGRGFDLRL